jgi:hypothetical protein
MANDKNKKTYESSNTYVLYNVNDFWADELEESINLYKKLFTDRIFVDSYNNNDKSANGYIARINYLESLGKASAEQINKRNNLLSDNVSDTKTNLSIKSLLENSDLPLYMIYQERNNEPLAEKYYQLECEFGLIDDNSKILVDRKYYTWVLTNYQKFSEEHIINSVSKHIREHDRISNPFGMKIKNIDSSNLCEVPEAEADEYLEQELATGTNGASQTINRFAADEDDLF